MFKVQNRNIGIYHNSQGIANKPPISTWNKVNSSAAMFLVTKACFKHAFVTCV